VYLIEIKSTAIRHVATGANHVPPASVFVSQRNSIHSVVIDMLNATLGLHHDGAPLIVRIQRPATGEIWMTSTDDWKKTVRLNKLLGMWAAEKLGITGEDAEAYSDALAVGTLDPERSDVLGKIRKDFDAAGVVQSDEQILRVMNELTLQAGNLMQVTRGGAADGLALMLARQLKSQ
jgi:hypothetical protein